MVLKGKFWYYWCVCSKKFDHLISQLELFDPTFSIFDVSIQTRVINSQFFIFSPPQIIGILTIIGDFKLFIVITLRRKFDSNKIASDLVSLLRSYRFRHAFLKT